jgi:ATP-dependent helicase/nuclease subunit B
MGLLETRSLDFENVILVSVNEGILPAGKSNRSFITYDLKKEYKLPTTKEKDAVYTYHFYRLLHRAKNISLLYNNQTSGIQTGEKSRFLLQLAYESPVNHTITEKLYTPKITIPKKKVRQIEKTPQIIEKLKALAFHGFSPSGLTTYIRNPIDFYDRYILGIRDLEEIEETVAMNTLGTIVHDTLQHLYEPYLNTVLTEDILNQIQKKADSKVAEEFSKTYKDGNIKSGKNRIIFEIAKRYVHNYLKQELQLVKEKNEITITQIENKLEAELTIPELDFPVKIKGLVDRVDQFNNTTRIIDFKTGKVTQTDLNLINWEDVMTDYKYSKIIQVLCYAVMTSEHINKGDIHAGIISFKNQSAGFMPFTKKENTKRRR